MEDVRVRCSSCEPLLDRYLEGTLAPREMAFVRAHLTDCEHCTALLGELRVVDALLATTPAVELAPNFTFAVMAEARTATMHAPRRFPLWAVLGGYVAIAWVVAMICYFGFGSDFAGIRSAIVSLGAQVQTALSVFTHSLGSSTPLLVGSVITILAIDALLAAGALYLYRSARLRARRQEAL
jgi:anti-sigma factor RsiW